MSEIANSTKVYLKPIQISKMELAKMIKGWKPLFIFGKSSILDVWQCSKYASDTCLNEREPAIFVYDSEMKVTRNIWKP